jgi:hypothetical protein
MVYLTCEPANLTFITTGVNAGAARCSNWVTQTVPDSSFWQSLDIASLQQMEQKALLMIMTVFVTWLIIHYITKS